MNLIATLFLATACIGGGGGDDTRLLFFTSDQCPACHNMQPAVEHLQSKGYPIEEINTSRSASWADRFQITQVPTFVLLKNGQEIDRFVGQLAAPELAQMINDANAKQTETRGVTSGIHNQRQSAPLAQQSKLQQNLTPVNLAANSERSAAAGGPQFVSTANTKSLTHKELAHQATVRLRVEDAKGTNHGTGTIIHVRDKEALVLTCGHIFRDSKGQGEIFADIGFPNDQRTVRGTLLKYDSEVHDVALLAIELDRPLQAVPVADAHFVPRNGDALFSVGCDRGAAPTVREGNMLRISQYNCGERNEVNVRKYDVSNRPIDGRSGGGLFSADGKLIGVCNAAVTDVDEGVYAGLESIYWQLDEAGLSNVFDVPAELPVTAPDPNTLAVSPRPAPPQRTPSPRNEPVVPAQLTFADELASNDIGDNLVPVTRVSNNAENDFEMIVILRSKKNPAETKSIVVSAPTPGLMQQIAAETSNGQRTDLKQMASGSPKPPARRIPRIADQEMRAQSPR